MHTITFTDEEWELVASLPDSGLGQLIQDYDDAVALGERILERRILEECWRNKGVYCDNCKKIHGPESPNIAISDKCRICKAPIVREPEMMDFTDEISELNHEDDELDYDEYDEYEDDEEDVDGSP
jgi:hypothetical protein